MNRKIYKIIMGSIVFSFVYPFSAFAENIKADFYVSPTGNDYWSGTTAVPNIDYTDGPFKTLTKARDAVRTKLTDMDKNIVVMLRDGKYFLDDTVIFGLADSGKNGYKIIYRNYPGEEPVFTSAVSITDWTKTQEPIAGLPEKARSEIWTAKVPDGLHKFYSLYDGEKMLPRARSEIFEPADDKASSNTFVYPKGMLKNWSNPDDIEILVLPTYGWLMNILPLESIDEQTRVAKTAVPGTHPLGKLKWWGEKNMWVENTLDVLDKPGEWVLNSVAGGVYYWPKSNEPGNDIVAPKLTEMIRVEGNIDYQGPVDEPVKNIMFQGLTFTHGKRYQWKKDHAGWGLQHDWEMFDEPTAIVRLRGAEGCIIEDCRFISSSETAIRLDLHCQKNRIANNLIKNIGGVGILLAGYGPGTKNVNRQNEIVQNHICNVGRLYWHSSAIFIWQSGENRIANNLIHNTPYSGIVVSGRIVWDRTGLGQCSKTIRWNEIDESLKAKPDQPSWREREPFLHGRNNIIERNDIHHVMEVMRDGNCIYISGTGAGNIVRENYCHDNLSAHMGASIRCDDDQNETTVDRNIIYHNGGNSNGIAIKGTNYIRNNIIADLLNVGGNIGLAGHRGLISLENIGVEGSIIEQNILYSTRAGQRVYFENLTNQGYGAGARLQDCKADYNVYYSTVDPNWGDNHLKVSRRHGNDVHSVSVDPMFTNLAEGRFDLDPNSPAIRLGFEQIDVAKIGLSPDSNHNCK